MAPSGVPHARRPVLSLILIAAVLVTACQQGSTSPTPGAGGLTGVGATPGASGDAGAGSSGGSRGAAGSGTTGQGGTGAQGGSGGTTGAQALQGAFESVVSTVGPSVVLIETSAGLGSGIVFDQQGDIVTNAHVVGTDTSFQVTTSSGSRLQAKLVGTFVPDDLAVIRVSRGSLSPATFGDSSKLAVGEIVLALGNPLGLQSSVTEGIVSALGRTVSEPGGAALAGVIQTSAAINPGNSGGALVDLDNQVIGIPTLAATDPQLGGSAPGIGFAIPSNTASDIASQLIQHGKVVSSHRAYLGVEAANIQSSAGVLVYSLDPNGPAAKAGIPQGVLITKVADMDVPDTATLSAVLATLSPGQSIPVVIERADGSTSTIQVTLGELPG
jgi:S1-C subfamily serine protease